MRGDSCVVMRLSSWIMSEEFERTILASGSDWPLIQEDLNWTGLCRRGRCPYIAPRYVTMASVLRGVDDMQFSCEAVTTALRIAIAFLKHLDFRERDSILARRFLSEPFPF